MFLFYKKELLFLLFVQLLKSPGKPWNFVGRPEKVLELWCKKSWKKWKNVLKSPRIWINFFDGNHESETSKLLRRAVLRGFVVVETWSPDGVCGPRFKFLPDGLHTYFSFWRVHILHVRMIGTKENIWVTFGDIFECVPVVIASIWKMHVDLVSFFNVCLTAFQCFEPDNFTLQW